MSIESSFRGFSREGLRFLEQLARHNDRAWFESNAERYEAELLAPARAFVDAMGMHLMAVAPGLHVDPRVGHSIRTLERPQVEGQDDPPYTACLNILFWSGHAPRDECSGFFFELEPPRLRVGAGIQRFTPGILEAYTKEMSDPQRGHEAARMLMKLRDRPGFAIGGRRADAPEARFDAEHPDADWLNYDGLFVYGEEGFPRALYSEKILEYCTERFTAMAPLHTWLRDLTSRIF